MRADSDRLIAEGVGHIFARKPRRSYNERDYRRLAQIFVAVLGASNFTYAEASWMKEQHRYAGGLVNPLPSGRTGPWRKFTGWAKIQTRQQHGGPAASARTRNHRHESAYCEY